MKPTKKPAQPIQLTPALLKSIIEEEVKGFGDMEDVEKRAKDTDETDADEFADSLEEPVDWKKANHIKEADTLDGHVDYMKALKIEESRLTKRLAQVRTSLQKGAKKLVVARIV
jgi:hypothetical protein